MTKKSTVSPLNTEINRGKIIFALGLMTLALVAAHLAALMIADSSHQLRRAFNLGLEANVPTWFSSVLLLLVSIAAFLCYKQSRVWTHKNTWLTLAIIFVVLSCDEVAMLHENVIPAAASLVFGMKHTSTIRSAWSVLSMPFLIPAAIWFWSRLRVAFGRDPQAKKLFILGVAVYFGCAVGVEYLGNMTLALGLSYLQRILLVVEEAGEMSGAIILLASLFKHEEYLKGLLLQDERFLRIMNQTARQQKRVLTEVS